MFWNILYVILDLFLTPTKKSGYSLRGFFGEIKHFNKHGVQIGYSLKSFWGGRNRYDMNGKLVSYTLKSFWGGYDTYDGNGNLIRTSRKNFWGGYNTYDRKGTKIRESYRDFWGGMNHFDIENANNLESFTIERRNVSKKRMDSDINFARKYSSQNTSKINTSSKRYTTYKPSENANVKNKTKAQVQTRTKEYSSVNKDNNKELSRNTPLKVVVDNSSVVPIKDDIKKINNEIKETYVADGVESYNKDNSNKGESKDKKVDYYSSVEEYLKSTSIKQYAKILVFEYKGMSEFPAITYLDQDVVIVQPLIYGEESSELKLTEVKEAKRICVTGLDMSVMDNEFLLLALSDIGKEFEELLPEYPLDMNGMSRIQYVFEGGLIITEKSMDELKELLG